MCEAVAASACSNRNTREPVIYTILRVLLCNLTMRGEFVSAAALAYVVTAHSWGTGPFVDRSVGSTRICELRSRLHIIVDKFSDTSISNFDPMTEYFNSA